MTASDDTPVLAIDGGGTRCRIALARGAAVTIVETGSANVTSNFDAAMGEIAAGLDALVAKTDTPLAELPAYIGLAGMISDEIATRIANALPFQCVQISDDRPAAIRGVLGDGDGFVAHCGTGSFIGRQRDHGQKIVGGWGFVLGDPASAAWVGRQALTATLDTIDGLSAPSALTRKLLAHFQTAAGIVAFAASASPAEFGAFAPDVTRHADQNDPIACAILQSAAKSIADTFTALGWIKGQPICLTGGIGPLYAAYLPTDMQAALTSPKGTPLDGALSFARDLAREALR